MNCKFFDKKINILTHNADGHIYMLEADNIEELLEDWYGNCWCVPENDAAVYFASLNSERIDINYSGVNFESVLDLLRQKLQK